MQTENDTSKPEDSPKQKAGEDCSGASCSPSSLTPETDEAWKAVSRMPDGMYDSRVPVSAFALAMSRHSKKMEMERNAAIRVLRVLKSDIDHIGHWIPDPCRAMVDTFLLENV